jgi:hypothetical protein
VKKSLLPPAGLLVAILVVCPLALAGQVDPFTAPNVASDDTPARRAPVTTATQDMNRAADQSSGAAIFNPFSQAPARVEHPQIAVSASAPADSSLTTTLVAALAGIAMAAYLFRKLLT